MKYEFTVTHLAHFSHDQAKVVFQSVVLKKNTYQGWVIFKISGVHVSDIQLYPYPYSSQIYEESNPEKFFSDKSKEEIIKEIHRMIRLDWKNFIQILCSTKLTKISTELEKAQKKVEKLISARDLFQQITGE